MIPSELPHHNPRPTSRSRFFSVLNAPIYHAEQHYKKRYHGTFQHAKKLFFIDLTLLLSTLGLGLLALTWFLYHPGIVDQISLTITPSKTRIASGDSVVYTVTYKNNSPISLTDPELTLDVPDSITVEKTEPISIAGTSSLHFTLDTVPAGHGGTISIAIRYYGTPEEPIRLLTHLSYRTSPDADREEKITPIIITPRGSRLETTLSIPQTIIGIGTTPISISVTNHGDLPLRDIHIPLPRTSAFSIVDPAVTDSTITGSIWIIPELAGGASNTLSAILKTTLNEKKNDLAITIIPALVPHHIPLPQVPITKKLTVIHPSLTVSSKWNTANNAVPAGTPIGLHLTLHNTGSHTLHNTLLVIEIPATLVDIPALTQQWPGAYRDNTLTIDSDRVPLLASIAPNTSVPIDITVPVRHDISVGTDITLNLVVRALAAVENSPSTFTISATTPAIDITSAIFLQAESRYYTNDGEQLGRGPLPPQIDKPTKYWVVLSFKNTTSQITLFRFESALAPHAIWTGKTSVSRGPDVTYHAGTHTVSWQIPYIQSHEQVAVAFELSVTPNAPDRGTIPPLLRNLDMRATDERTRLPLHIGLPSLTASLSHDALAQKKGVVVE